MKHLLDAVMPVFNVFYPTDACPVSKFSISVSTQSWNFHGIRGQSPAAKIPCKHEHSCSTWVFFEVFSHIFCHKIRAGHGLVSFCLIRKAH